MRADVLSADERAGGQYEIAMRGKDPEGNDATLTLELAKVAGGTQIRLVHEGLPNEEAVHMHAQGWESCPAKLEQALA